MKGVLMSFFESGNIGDILIADTLYEFFSQYVSLSCCTYSGKFVSKSELIVNKNGSIKSRLYKMLLKNPITNKIIDNRKINSITDDYSEFAKKIVGSDVFIIGGGNAVMSLDKRSIFGEQIEKYIDIAKKHNTKVFACAIGIGPFAEKAQEKKAAAILNKCDYISFRDAKSMSYYSNIYGCEKCMQTVDPVFAMKAEYSRNSDGAVAINIINPSIIDENADSKKIIKAYIAMINKLTEEYTREIILFTSEVNDYPALKKVYSGIKNKEKTKICCVKSIDELDNIYRQTSVLIGTRMHSMITAYIHNIPVIGLCWQDKVREFFKIIKSKDAFELYNLDKEADNISYAVKKYINNKEYCSSGLGEKFKKNIDILKKIQES